MSNDLLPEGIEHYENVAARIVGTIAAIGSVRKRLVGTDSWGLKSRIKDDESIQDKLERKQRVRPSYSVTDMPDLVGIRVVVESVTGARALDAYIREHRIFEILEEECENYLAHPREDGYRGIHLVVEVESRLARSTRIRAEIQIRTLLQHQWSILSHSEFYKSAAEIPPSLLRRMQALSQILGAADDEADELRRSKLMDEVGRLFSDTLREDLVEKLHGYGEGEVAYEVGIRVIELLMLESQLRRSLIVSREQVEASLAAVESLYSRVSDSEPAIGRRLERLIARVVAVTRGIPDEA